jgi:SAM-dependent methyltransferase
MATESAPDLARLEFIKQYLLQRERGLDAALLELGDPRGKDVLVFGCGKGNEILWCATRQAKSVLGIDLSPIYPDALDSLLKDRGQESFPYQMQEIDVQELALSRPRQFDLILSNGVFEHVSDMRGVLNAFRTLLKPKGRVAVYADGLWFSSIGGHLGTENWEHLWMSEEGIKETFPKRWFAYKRNLNRMSSVDFLSALRDVGAVIQQFRFRTEPHMHRVRDLMDKMRAKQELTPTDLSIIAVGCEFCFLEHL